jgi:hypothetical protein
MRYNRALVNVCHPFSLPPTTASQIIAMLLPPLHAQPQRPGQNTRPVPLFIVSVIFPTLHGFGIMRRSNGLFIQTLRH